MFMSYVLRQFVVVTMLSFLIGALLGCSTTRGVGQDVEAVGEAVEETAEETEEELED